MRQTSLQGAAALLQNPVIVAGQIESFDWATNTAIVQTQLYGNLKCRIGTEYSDTDWQDSGAEQDNTQFGAKRPYYARERVLVLLMGGSRVVDGVIVCSISTTNNKLNTETQVKGEHQDDPYEIEGKRVLHIRDDYWLRTIKQVMQIAVEDMLLRSESGRIDVDAYTDIKLRAKEENVTIDAEKKDVVTHAGQDVLTTSDRDTKVTAATSVAIVAGDATHMDAPASIEAKGPASLTSDLKDVSIVATAGNVNLGLESGTGEPALFGNTLITLLTSILSTIQVWAASHTHPCTAPGTPSGPAIPPLVLMPPWSGGKEATKSIKVKVQA